MSLDRQISRSPFLPSAHVRSEGVKSPRPPSATPRGCGSRLAGLRAPARLSLKKTGLVDAAGRLGEDRFARWPFGRRGDRPAVGGPAQQRGRRCSNTPAPGPTPCEVRVMSERTTPTPAVNPPFAALAAQALPWWGACSPEQQAAVQADLQASGLDPEEYLASAREFASYAELVAEAGIAGADAPAEQPAPEQPTEGAESEEARLARLGAEAKGLLRDDTRAFRRGESAYRAGMLEGGRLAGEYVH